MIRTTLFLLFLTLALSGNKFGSNEFVIVDNNSTGDFLTIQGAIDSGANYIQVRAGTYHEVLVVTRTLTIESKGVIIPNDGQSTSIHITAPNVVLKGDLLIQGDHEGTSEAGEFYDGVGVTIEAHNITISGLRTQNLRSFSVLLPEPTAHHVTIEDFDFRNVALSPTPQLYANTAIQLINGASHNSIRDGYVTGYAQAVGTWYGSSYNEVYNNRFENNYGWIGANGSYSSRSTIEDYGVENAPNYGNRFYDNTVEGSNGAAFELADVLFDTVVRNNTIRNVHNAFGVQGSGSNRGVNITIESNSISGDGDDYTNWFSGSGVIRNNTFTDYVQNNEGTIKVSGDGLGNVDITGNTFIRGGRVLRYSAQSGAFNFSDNRIEDAQPQSGGLLYFDSTLNPSVYVEGNTFIGTSSRVVYANWATPVKVRGNHVEGEIWVGAGGVVEHNDIRSEEWVAVYIYDGTIVRANLISTDGQGVGIQGGTANSLVERNYITKLDGSAATLPNCGTLNTCVGNWTYGQIPP